MNQFFYLKDKEDAKDFLQYVGFETKNKSNLILYNLQNISLFYYLMPPNIVCQEQVKHYRKKIDTQNKTFIINFKFVETQKDIYIDPQIQLHQITKEYL